MGSRASRGAKRCLSAGHGSITARAASTPCRRLQRFRVNPKQSRDPGGGSTFLQHFLRLPDLSSRQFRRPPKVAAGALGRIDAAVLSLAGLFTLQLSERREGLGNEAADRRGIVQPGHIQNPHEDATPVLLLEQDHQFTGAALLLRGDGGGDTGRGVTTPPTHPIGYRISFDTAST